MINKQKQFGALIFAAAVILSVTDAHAARSKAVESSLIIDASPQVVFEAIQKSRSLEPTHRKLVSHHDGVAVIDERFTELPVIGNARCTYKEVETPYKRIDFSLLSSEKLKAFESSWILTPVSEGAQTEVRLNTYSEPKVWLPFAREVASTSILKDIRRRLSTLKSSIESEQSSISSHANFQSISHGANSIRSYNQVVD